MQIPAVTKEMLNGDSQTKRIRAFIPLVLIVVVLTALFSLNSTSEQNVESNKYIPTADAAGASPPGTGGCVPSQAWVDQLIAERQNAVNNLGPFLGGLYRLGDWANYVNYGICPPRPDNPIVSFKNCVNPQITVAILVDRSTSVIKDGSDETPEDYKRQVRTLIDEFHDRFTQAPRNGTVNFLIYAFGTKAVLQNPTTNNAFPVLTNIRTDASTEAGKTAMINAINDIHFRNEDQSIYFDKREVDTSGFQRRDNSLYQIQRAYNAGSESSPGEYGRTNWQDAFIKVMEAGSSSKYNHPGEAGIGKRIDLAVMITDGLPTADDGADWDWTAGTFRGSPSNISFNPALDGINLTNANDVASWNDRSGPSDPLYHDRQDDLYRITTGPGGNRSATKAVDMLRSGSNPADFFPFAQNIASRPPISVKGIVIATSPDNDVRNDSRNYASQVFGEGNFFFATNFTNTLEDEVKSLVTNVIKESNCPTLNDPVTPLLEVNVTTPLVTPMEGTSETIKLTVTNNTKNASMLNIVIYNCGQTAPEEIKDIEKCTKVATDIDLAPGKTSEEFDYVIKVVLGQPQSSLNFVAIGEPSLGNGQTLTKSMDPIFKSVAIVPGRESLPA